MSSKERFDAFYGQPADNELAKLVHAKAWAAWKESERQALEIAERICGDYEYTDAAERMIRALIEDASK